MNWIMAIDSSPMGFMYIAAFMIGLAYQKSGLGKKLP